MALSVRLPAGKGPYIEHYLIQANNGKLSLETSENRFDNIPSLIAHYSQCWWVKLSSKFRIANKIQSIFLFCFVLILRYFWFKSKTFNSVGQIATNYRCSWRYQGQCAKLRIDSNCRLWHFWVKNFGGIRWRIPNNLRATVVILPAWAVLEPVKIRFSTSFLNKFIQILT